MVNVVYDRLESVHGFVHVVIFIHYHGRSLNDLNSVQDWNRKLPVWHVFVLSLCSIWVGVQVDLNVVSFFLLNCPSIRKRGTLKLIRQSVCPSVTKTLTLLISSEVLMIEHWYLTCMILVTRPFNWHHAVTLTFDLLQGQSCCRAGDHSSQNLLVIFGMEFSFTNRFLVFLSLRCHCG